MQQMFQQSYQEQWVKEFTVEGEYKPSGKIETYILIVARQKEIWVGKSARRLDKSK